MFDAILNEMKTLPVIQSPTLLKSCQKLITEGWSVEIDEIDALSAFKPYFAEAEKGSKKELLAKMFLLKSIFNIHRHNPGALEGGINWIDEIKNDLSRQFEVLCKANPLIKTVAHFAESAQIERNPRQPLPMEKVIVILLALGLVLKNSKIDINVRGPIHLVLALLTAGALVEFIYGRLPRDPQLSNERLTLNRFINRAILISDTEWYQAQTMFGKATVIQKHVNALEQELAKKNFLEQCKVIIEKGWDPSFDEKPVLANLKPTNDVTGNYLTRLCLLKLLSTTYKDQAWLQQAKAKLTQELNTANNPITQRNQKYASVEGLVPILFLLNVNRYIGSDYAPLIWIPLLVYGFASILGYITPLSARVSDRFYPTAESVNFRHWHELQRAFATPQFQDAFVLNIEQPKRPERAHK